MSAWISIECAKPLRSVEVEVVFKSRGYLAHSQGDQTVWRIDKTNEEVLYWRVYEEDSEVDQDVIS